MPYQKVKEYYDSLASAYDKKYDNPAMNHMRRIESEVIEQYLDNVKSIVDIGCGTGLYALALGKRGYNVLATDISYEMIKVAKLKAESLGLQNEITLLQHDIEKQLIIEKKFDLAISMFGALNHVESLKKAFKNIKDVLTPGGHFIFTIANSESLHRFRTAHKNHRLTDMVHGTYPKTSEFYVREAKKKLWTRYYTREEVKTLLKSNFEIEKIGGIFLFVKPQYHNVKYSVSKKKEVVMRLERTMRWVFPVNFYSEYLLIVCKEE